MSEIVKQLMRTPVSRIQIDRIMAFDWHDGPLSGYLCIAQPKSCWRFEAIAERQRQDETDDGLYVLFAAPDDIFEQLNEVLAPLGPEPNHRFWTPSWRFDDEEDRTATELALDRLEQGLNIPSLIVRSSSLTKISQMWRHCRNRQ